MTTRLGAFSLGFLSNPSLKRALSAAGYDIRIGPLTKQLDGVAVWGDRPVAARARKAAQRRKLPCVFVEDAFLRSVKPDETSVLGLTIDHQRPYFDATGPSDLEDLLNHAQPDQSASLAFEEYLSSGLSKYNHCWQCPEQLEQDSFVIVVDQRQADASIRLGGAQAKDFELCLEAALDENPHRNVMIRAHPRGQQSYFDINNLPDRATLLPRDIAPVFSIQRAKNVYCVTSQMGFEAVLHGKRPKIFGQPFYAGWGLTDDMQNMARRSAALDRDTLFRTVMIDYCKWLDPATGDLIEFVDALRILAARSRHAKMVSKIRYGAGIGGWKRKFIRKLIPGITYVPPKASHFRELGKKSGAETVVWASRCTDAFETAALDSGHKLWRMEDGFVRSKGLGAALTPPRSLVLDKGGIYYDPSSNSDLQHLIAKRTSLLPHQTKRARSLIFEISAHGVSKYNLQTANRFDRRQVVGQKIVLVPGQVEDDASVLTGGAGMQTNAALLTFVRQKNPDAFIIYKPHPDVEAGFRSGGNVADDCADMLLPDSDPLELISQVDEVWTLTSLLGFEAVMRGRKTICVGRPFYAGWGLTFDVHGNIDTSRGTTGLTGLVHAALIDYPVYFSPLTGQVTSIERHLAYLDLVRPQARLANSLLQRSRNWVRKMAGI